jgi:hypothetical protein
MYSRHSRGFFARSVFNRMLRAPGLQLPYFVFIFCTKTRFTFTPTIGLVSASSDHRHTLPVVVDKSPLHQQPIGVSGW